MNRPQDITSVQKMERVYAVEKLLLAGASINQIEHFCTENYKVEVRAMWVYIKAAREKIKKQFEDNFDKDYFTANYFERLEDLYRKSYANKNFKECRNIIKEIRDMIGLDAPKKIDTSLAVTEFNISEVVKFKSD